MSKATRPQFVYAAAMERWPWAVRAVLGVAASTCAVSATYAVHPLRGFPLLLAFPTVILSSWFLGMWGGVLCALTDVILVDAFLTRPSSQFSITNSREEARMALFLFVSIFLGWAIRRLAQQRSELATQQLHQRLAMANAERRLAEERAAASAATRDREELLQLALRANGMGLWLWDLDQGTVYRSDEMFRMIGCEPDAFGQEPENWFDHVHPEDRPGLVEEFHRLRCAPGDHHRQYRVVWPDGSVHWLESQGKCQTNAAGRVTRIVGVMADVTHRKQAEEAMLRAEKLAVAGKLAASVAHEINNPLAAVTNLLYLISSAETVENARAQALTALDEVMRVSLITQQTLKFHRQTGEPKATLLSEVIESTVALFRGRSNAAEVAVDVRVKDEYAVPCLSGEAQQIFANLVSNAIEATLRGGRLVVALRPSLDWRNGVDEGMRVTVCDTGCGMSRATLRRIFEPFFTTKTETGTGLGLWVVAQLVERHHGHVRAWSWRHAKGSGSAFSVFLPRTGKVNAPLEEREEAAEKVTS